MKVIKLKRDRPFIDIKGRAMHFVKGEMFEVLHEADFPMMGKGYKIRSIKWNIELDGYNASKDFEECGAE